MGETVFAVGNPLGELDYTMTRGMISAMDREIGEEDSTINMFQIDAAINNGNSGGGMFSGRMTTPLVAAGALMRDMIAPLGISVGSYLSRIGNVVDLGEYAAEELVRSRDNPLRAMTGDLAERMRAEILVAKAEGDSVGGIVGMMNTSMVSMFGDCKNLKKVKVLGSGGAKCHIMWNQQRSAFGLWLRC